MTGDILAMTDLQFLYVVMAAFYLWECTHWLGNVTVPFVSWLGPVTIRARPSSSESNGSSTRTRTRDEDEGGAASLGKSFRISQPFFVSNSREGGLHFASPLPAVGTFFVTTEWPFAVSPLGVANHLGGAVRFADQPRFGARRQQIRANGQLFARTASTSHAHWLAGQLNQIVAASEADREARVAKLLNASLDSCALAARLAEFSKAARVPSMTASVLTLFVFLVAPGVLWRWGLLAAWPWLLGVLVILCVVNSMGFLRTHKRLHPGLGDERFTHYLMVLLFPPAGMRSRDLLSRPLLERFHPLAAANELCSPAHFRELASRVLRESRYPRPRALSADGDAAKVWEWFHQRMGGDVERFAVHHNLSLDQLLAAPALTDSDSRSYCPRCHAPFALAEGTCSDCGVALVRFQSLDA